MRFPLLAAALSPCRRNSPARPGNRRDSREQGRCRTTGRHLRTAAGPWFVARQVSQGNDPCTPEACEAGFNSGDLAVSVEHAKEYVRVVAGFRGCQGVAFQEVETGMKPGSSRRGEVSDLIKDVVKGAAKSCKVKAPSVPKLDVSSLFPKA